MKTAAEQKAQNLKRAQKENGVYYTPSDVTDYISAQILSGKDLTKTIFDPTCGTGEFLVSAVKIKIGRLVGEKYTDEDILKIAATIYGNDIDTGSIRTAISRVVSELKPLLKVERNFTKLTEILNQNFTSYDFVCEPEKLNKTFDIILGNPPYVEYGKFAKKNLLKNNHGNIYADVLKNSLEVLNDGGELGFVVPLSYIATVRMRGIRKYVAEKTAEEKILSFADRPDCLFAGVHQKLNIIILKKSDVGIEDAKNFENHKIYTSSYKHWSTVERKDLFKNIEIVLNKKYYEDFIPKIGNKLDQNIFEKVWTGNAKNLLDEQKKGGEEVFLNMRLCFWTKAFDFNPGSKEYKSFYYDVKYCKYILCILNSSLFWLYWTFVSDGWHITKKELEHFKFVPIDGKNLEKFDKLYDKLSKKLEQTKKYVGTRQVTYEYKHKMCKDVIDEIDAELAKIYNLDKEELDYVQNFAIKYRMGDLAGGIQND